MSQGPMSNSPSKGGTMRSQAPTSYQSPFGNQNYRTQTSPSKGGQPSFGGPAYQQPGQFGGQIMNRPMQSPGGKGGQSRPPMSIQPYPMPSPGGKGGSYQRPPMPYGYGQPTFAPQQFSGYGQPSNIFSFNNPHYQPYMPPTYGSGQTGQSPDIGNNPMTPQPEVMAQPVDQSAAMREQIKNLGQEGIQSGAVTRDMLIQAGYSNPDQILGGVSGNQNAVQVEPPPQQVINPIPPEPQDRIVDPKTAFTPPGGYNPIMPIGGKGGSGSSSPFIAIDPYGPGGSLEGQPRPTFPDPTQPQGPQGTVQGAPMNTPSFPAADMGSGLGSLFNSQQLAQRLQGAAGGPSPMQSPELIARDRAAYATSNPRLVSSAGPANPYAIGGSRNGQINPRFQNMR